MLKRIYLSPLGYIISAVLNILSIFTRPFMVYGYYNKTQKKFLRNTRISSTASILHPERLAIGDNCWIWHHSIIDASNNITIGKGTQIGAFVGIFTHSSHIAIRLLGEDFIKQEASHRIGYVRAPVIIGDYTFIAASSIIMPGTIIGKGCVIGAGSIVRGNIPDFSIVSGNPAKVIGSTDSLDRRYLNYSEIESTYFDLEHLAFLKETKKQKSQSEI